MFQVLIELWYSKTEIFSTLVNRPKSKKKTTKYKVFTFYDLAVVN